MVKDQQEKKLYTLSSEKLRVDILNYGAAIYNIMAPDREGRFENVVLFHENLEEYEDNPEYYGVIVGRVAGRISDGEFSLKGKKYNLDKNNGNNHLHGGATGFSKKLWNVEKISKDALQFCCKSSHLEDGFPANIEMKVRYTLKDDILTIEYEGIADEETILNLTNHSYFNLSGDEKEDIFSHSLFIDASHYIEVDAECLPAEIKSCDKTHFDFRQERKIEWGHYDNPYILEKEKRILYSHSKSGRVLEIVTDQPAVVVYAGWYLKKRNMGLALETQDFPNAVNDERFETKVYKPGKPYIQKTSYRFYTR